MNPMLQHLQAQASSGTGSQMPTIPAGPEGGNQPLVQAMNYVKQCGGDPRSAFMRLAQEKGLDPAAILRSIR